MKLFAKIIVALLVTSLVLVGPAIADTKIPTHTKLTVNDRKVTQGTKVNWKIHVTSKNKKCYANRKVKWLKNGNFKHYKTVGANGVLKFHKKMNHTSTYQAKLPKKEWGVHPHHHVCETSKSKK